MLKLAYSYSGTLYLLKRGKVTEADLMACLIYFACTRRYALDPENEDLEMAFYDADPAEKERIHALIGRVILAAEKDGRIRWRKDANTPVTYEQLNELLTKHGLPALKISPPQSFYYNKGVVQRAVREQLAGKLEILGQ
jgi:hypothetical protein